MNPDNFIKKTYGTMEKRKLDAIAGNYGPEGEVINRLKDAKCTS